MAEKKENKYITSIKAKVQKKIDKLREEAQSAYLDWADTGYQRYMNKKDRLEAEADELESFIKPELNVKSAWAKADKEAAEKEKLILLLKSVGNVVEDEMKYEFPDSHATRRLEDIVSKFKYEYLNQFN